VHSWTGGHPQGSNCKIDGMGGKHKQHSRNQKRADYVLGRQGDFIVFESGRGKVDCSCWGVCVSTEKVGGSDF